MRTWLVAALSFPLCIPAGPARAAQPTELIPFLHMDAELGYAGSVQFGRVREEADDGTFYDVASYNHSRHEMDVDIEFGVAPWLELDLRFPAVFQDRLNYRSSNDLSYDVAEDRTTMLGNDPIPDDELKDDKRSGFGDMWIALQFSPFNEHHARPSPATLLLDLGISPPTGKSRYETNSQGAMYPGSGGTDLRLGAAFSKTMKGGEPYMWVQYVSTGRYEVDLLGSDGQSVYGGPVQLNPADTVHVVVGTELYAMKNPSTDAGINVDLYGGFTYYSWADMEAGTLLPVIHEKTEGYLVTSAEYLEPQFGLGLYIRPTDMVQIRLNVGADYEMSHLLERLNERNYEFYTGADTIRINFGLTVAGSFAPPKKGAQVSPIL